MYVQYLTCKEELKPKHFERFLNYGLEVDCCDDVQLLD